MKVPRVRLVGVIVVALIVSVSSTALAQSSSSAPAPSEALKTATKIQKQIDKLFPRKQLIVKGNTTRGINGKEITVDGVVAQAQAADNPVDPFPGMCEGAQARFDRANKKNEIKGYTFKYNKCYDDQSTPATNLTQLQTAVEQDQAFAIVPMTSQGFLPANGNYLNQKHVIYMGYAFMPPYCGYANPFGFGTGGTVSCGELDAKGKGAANDILIGSYAQATKKAAKDIKVAGIAENTTAGIPGIKIVKTGVESVGAKMVYAEAPLPFSSDPPGGYKPFAQAMIDSGANLMMIVTSAGKVQQMIEALRDAGYTGDIMNFVYSDDRVFLSPSLKKAVANVYTVSPVVGASGNGGAAFTQIADDMIAAGFSKVGKVVPTPVTATTLTSGAIYGYGSADQFLAALKDYLKTGKKLTSENLANFINRGWQYKGLGEAIGPANFPSGHIVAAPSGSAIQADITANGGKGQWKVVTPLRAFSQSIVTVK